MLGVGYSVFFWWRDCLVEVVGIYSFRGRAGELVGAFDRFRLGFREYFV